MKNLTSLSLAAALAITTLTSTAALAQPYQPGPPGPPHGPGYYHPQGPRPGPSFARHRWRQGDRFYGNRYAVNNWHRYRLRPPPPGYQWVQDNGQFVLIGIASGIIASVILNSQVQQ